MVPMIKNVVKKQIFDVQADRRGGEVAGGQGVLTVSVNPKKTFAHSPPG